MSFLFLLLVNGLVLSLFIPSTLFHPPLFSWLLELHQLLSNQRCHYTYGTPPCATRVIDFYTSLSLSLCLSFCRCWFHRPYRQFMGQLQLRKLLLLYCSSRVALVTVQKFWLCYNGLVCNNMTERGIYFFQELERKLHFCSAPASPSFMMNNCCPQNQYINGLFVYFGRLLSLFLGLAGFFSGFIYKRL